MAKPSLGAPAPASPFFTPASDQSTVSHLKVTVQSVTTKPDGSLHLDVVSGNVRFGVTIFNLPGRPDFKKDDRLILEYPKGANPLTDYTAGYYADAVTTIPQQSLLHRSNTVSEISTVQNNALIPTFQSTIGGHPSLCCDARALHTYLGNARQFSDWFKQRIEQYGFDEKKDYELVSQNCEIKKEGRGGDRRSTDYHLTINMAKELSMVENNEQGKIARRYFIECESIALGQGAAPKPKPEPKKRIQSNRDHVSACVLLLRSAAKDLKLAPSAILGGYQRIEEQLGVAGLLPHYATDAPVSSTSGSSEVVKPVSELLIEFDVGMSAVKFNRLLVEKGIIEEVERKSTNGTKTFKSVRNLEYGKNATHPSNPKETQPMWYPGKFQELIDLVLPAKLEAVS